MIATIKGHNIITKYLTGDSMILDLGANKGVFANEINRLTGAKVVSIEPFKENFDLIPQKGNIKKMNVAVSDQAKQYYLLINENSESNSLTHIKPQSGLFSIVEGLTFQQILDSNKLSIIDLVKMDIEGAEIGVIKSIDPEVLKDIKQITIEFHDFIKGGSVSRRDVLDICNILKAAGFSMIKFSPRSYKDVLFLNRTVFSKSDIFKASTIYKIKYWIALTYSKLTNGDL